MPIRLNNADDQTQPAAWTGGLVQVTMIRHPNQQGSNLAKDTSAREILDASRKDESGADSRRVVVES